MHLKKNEKLRWPNDCLILLNLELVKLNDTVEFHKYMVVYRVRYTVSVKQN